MIRKVNRAFLIMELLVSLAIISIGFGTFLTVYFSIQRHHTAVQHREAAVLLLQSVLEKVRGGQIPEAWTPANWTSDGKGRVVCPAQPAVYHLDSPNSRYRWQLSADHPPEHGKLWTLQAMIQWQDESSPRLVKATTQLFLP